MIAEIRSILFRRVAKTSSGGDVPPLLPGPGGLFDVLSKSRAGSGYSAEDRRQDFRTVLLGSEAGRRVLYELLAWSHLFASTFVPGGSHATHWREGGRDVGLRILAALSPEPPSKIPESADGDADATDIGDRP